MLYIELKNNNNKIYLIDAIAVLSGDNFLSCKLRTCHDNLSSDLSSAVFCNMQLRTARTIKRIFFSKLNLF